MSYLLHSWSEQRLRHRTLICSDCTVVTLAAFEPQTRNELMMHEVIFFVAFLISGSITPSSKKNPLGKCHQSYFGRVADVFFVFCRTVQLDRLTSLKGYLEHECDDRLLWLQCKCGNWGTCAALQKDYMHLLIVRVVYHHLYRHKDLSSAKTNKQKGFILMSVISMLTWYTEAWILHVLF